MYQGLGTNHVTLKKRQLLSFAGHKRTKGNLSNAYIIQASELCCLPFLFEPFNNPGWEGWQVISPFYKVAPWGQQKWRNSHPHPWPQTSLLAVVWSQILWVFLFSLVPNTISCGREASPLLSNHCLPCCLRLCLLFSAGPSAEGLFQPSQFRLLRDSPGKGVRMAVLPLSICKLISTFLIPQFLRSKENWDVGQKIPFVCLGVW